MTLKLPSQDTQDTTQAGPNLSFILPPICQPRNTFLVLPTLRLPKNEGLKSRDLVYLNSLLYTLKDLKNVWVELCTNVLAFLQFPPISHSNPIHLLDSQSSLTSPPGSLLSPHSSVWPPAVDAKILATQGVVLVVMTWEHEKKNLSPAWTSWINLHLSQILSTLKSERHSDCLKHWTFTEVWVTSYPELLKNHKFLHISKTSFLPNQLHGGHVWQIYINTFKEVLH